MTASTRTLCVLLLHVDDVRLSAGEGLQDVAEIFVRDIDVERFHWFEQRAVLRALEDDLRPGDEDLKAFAAHLLDEDRDLHFAARLDLEVSGGFCLCDVQRNIRARLADEPLPDLARGEEFAFAAGERRIVDADLHRDRRRIDVHEGQRHALLGVGDRLADEDVLKAGDADDVAFAGRFDFDLLQAFVAENRGDIGARFRSGVVDANHGLADLARCR